MRLAALPRRTRLLVLLLTAGLGGLLFVWRLGSAGLVDETPPLFAASARAMVSRGDWLIPHVNGLPRYDKPPLVYWLMGLLYALPGQGRWDPLGTWASSLPSALATIAVMLALADTLLRWPQPLLRHWGDRGRAGAAAAGPLDASGNQAVPRSLAPQGPLSGPGPVASPRRHIGALDSGTDSGSGIAPRAAMQAGGELEAALAGWPSPLLPPAARRRAVLTALTAALAFALSPLVLLWGRIPVSDALFTAMVALSALTFWRRLADPAQPWALPWLLLGLAVLTKGPVAVVLLGLSLALFLLLQAEVSLLRRLRPVPGLLLTGLVALPWYGLALWRDGRAFWDSFFGYHNLQRFAEVVNDHRAPWWFFLPVLLVAALPVTPLLLLGLQRAIGPLRLRRRWGLPLPAAAVSLPPEQSLARFAACWLLAILLFFTAAATKLPSYWLPATPAAALLVALIAQQPWGSEPSAEQSVGRGGASAAARALSDASLTALAATAPLPAGSAAADPHRAALGSSVAAGPESPPHPPDRAFRLVWWLSLGLTALLALVFALASLWVPLISDPELPTLPVELLASGLLVRAAWLWGLALLLGWWLRARPAPLRLLALQLPLVLFVPAALLPSWALGDRLRGLPVRQMAAAAGRLAAPREPLAMVGILKPSLHYYSGRVVIYEGIEPEGLVNLADRLRREDRPGQHPAPPAQQPSVLVVIDRTTAASPFWQGLQPQELSRAGLYRLWRLDRRRLEARAAELQAAGHRLTWTLPRPERY